MDSRVIDYLKKSGNHLILGNYTEDVTLLGTLMQVGTGLLGVDLPMDLRDILYDFTHWKWSWEHAGKAGMDLLSVFPIIGGLKYTDEASSLAKAAFKNTDEASTLMKGALKNTDEISDIAKGVDETVDVATKGAAEAIANARYTRTLLQSMRSFMDDVASVVSKQEITIEKFNELRLKPLEKLTESEKSIMKVIRESVSMPDNTTIMQKVIPKGDIAKYIDGTYTQVGGYVTKAQDVKQLGTYRDIYDSLRLDYPGTVYNPSTDDVLGVIRFKTPQASSINIPYGKEMGGSILDSPPFTGNGFTSATNGQVIPEFKCGKYLGVYGGAELYEVGKDGKEVLRAIFDSEIGRFVNIYN